MRAVTGSTCFLLIFVLATAAGAQPPPGGGNGGRAGGQQPAMPDSADIVQMVDELAEKLSFSDEQYDQVLVIHFAHFNEAQERMAAGRPDRQEMETLRTEFENDVKAALHDDQLPAYEQYVESQRSQGGSGGARR